MNGQTRKQWEIFSQLHKAIDHERIDRGWTWTQVAEELNTSTSSLWRMKSGNSPNGALFCKAIWWVGDRRFHLEDYR